VWVLSLAGRGFSPGTSVFQMPIRLGIVDEEPIHHIIVIILIIFIMF